MRVSNSNVCGLVILTFLGLVFLFLEVSISYVWWLQGVTNSYAWGLVFLRLGVKNSYVSGLDLLRLRVGNSYVWVLDF